MENEGSSQGVVKLGGWEGSAGSEAWGPEQSGTWRQAAGITVFRALSTVLAAGRCGRGRRQGQTEREGPTVCGNVASAEGTLVLMTGTQAGGEGHGQVGASPGVAPCDCSCSPAPAGAYICPVSFAYRDCDAH